LDCTGAWTHSARNATGAITHPLKGNSVFSEREALLKCTERGQFLWPRRPPIIGIYRTLQTMVALPLGRGRKAVGAGGAIGKANFRQLPQEQ